MILNALNRNPPASHLRSVKPAAQCLTVAAQLHIFAVTQQCLQNAYSVMIEWVADSCSLCTIASRTVVANLDRHRGGSLGAH